MNGTKKQTHRYLAKYPNIGSVYTKNWYQQYRRTSAGTCDTNSYEVNICDTNSYEVNIGPALVANIQGYLQFAGDVGAWSQVEWWL